MKSIIKDEQAYSFIWIVLLFVLFVANMIWAVLYDVIKDFHLIHEEVYPDDIIGGFIFFVFEYFPIWVLIGVSLYGLVNSQKSDEIGGY